MANDDDKSSPAGGKTDVVLLGPPTADGAGVHVLRARDERLEAGELRNLEHGRPLTGEVLTLAPRKDNPRICDVKDTFSTTERSLGVEARAPASLPAAKPKGPAQVATQAYRDNWEEVFSRPRDTTLN